MFKKMSQLEKIIVNYKELIIRNNYLDLRFLPGNNIEVCFECFIDSDVIILYNALVNNKETFIEIEFKDGFRLLIEAKLVCENSVLTFNGPFPGKRLYFDGEIAKMGFGVNYKTFSKYNSTTN